MFGLAGAAAPACRKNVRLLPPQLHPIVVILGVTENAIIPNGIAMTDKEPDEQESPMSLVIDDNLMIYFIHGQIVQISQNIQRNLDLMKEARLSGKIVFKDEDFKLLEDQRHRMDALTRWRKICEDQVPELGEMSRQYEQLQLAIADSINDPKIITDTLQ